MFHYPCRAELRGTIVGLELAWEAGHRRVAAQVDSQVVINLLRASDDLNHQFAGEISTLCQLINRDLEVSFSHTYQEGNHVVDYLASIGHNLDFGLHFIPTSNCNLDFLLRQDCTGISEPRSIINE
ncbi:Putative ribonuclease H protein At1g65750 [Linum perenne]